MGNLLLIAGCAGLVLTAIAAPVAVVLLRRQARKLDERVRQEYEQEER